jgi:4-methyl-5(b-hydroxyethyl)-thiazole monophosphate biosynthesis
LGKLGVLDFKKAVCYPGFEEFMGKAIMQPQQTTAVADGNFITGKGAGAAIEFGLLIVEVLKGKQTALDLAKTLQCPMQSYK